MPAKPTPRTRAELERTRALLRKYVAASGVSQEALAQGLDLEPGALADILREGGEGFPLFQLFQILGALGVPPRDFFGRLYDLSPDVERPMSKDLDMRTIP